MVDRADGFRKRDVAVTHRPDDLAVFDGVPPRTALHVSHRHCVAAPPPPPFRTVAADDDGQIMAIAAQSGRRHLVGVQYHVEAPTSQPIGAAVLSNFLRLALECPGEGEGGAKKSELFV